MWMLLLPACVEPQRAAERKCLICSFQGESTLNPQAFLTVSCYTGMSMDLADLSARRAPVQKFTLKTRVRNLLQTQQAKRVAGRCASGLQRVCRDVVRLRGAATRG